MKTSTILAIVAILVVASMPLLSMIKSANAANTKPWPWGHSNGFLKKPNHYF
jgi:hypothetical protein